MSGEKSNKSVGRSVSYLFWQFQLSYLNILLSLIFSLAAQIRMSCQVVYHDNVTMLGRRDTVLFSNV